MYAPDLPRQRRQLVRLNHKARQFTQRTWHTPYNMSNSAARHHNHSLLWPSLGLLTTHSYIYHTTAHSLQRRSPGLSYNHSLPQLSQPVAFNQPGTIIQPLHSLPRPSLGLSYNHCLLRLSEPVAFNQPLFTALTSRLGQVHQQRRGKITNRRVCESDKVMALKQLHALTYSQSQVGAETVIYTQPNP